MTPPASTPIGPEDPASQDAATAAADALLAWIRTVRDTSSPTIADPQIERAVEAAAEAGTPPWLAPTAEEALEFGRRWHRALASRTFLQIHHKFAEHLFGRWTAILLAHLGAPVSDPELLFESAGPYPVPAQVGHELAYVQKLTADTLGVCVSMLSDLAHEYVPDTARRVKARVIGEFAGGFAAGLQERVRDEQAVLTTAFLHLGNPASDRDTAGPAHRFRAAVADTVTAVLALDEFGMIIEANATAQTLLGRTRAQLRALTLPELARCAEDADQIRRALHTLRRTTAKSPTSGQVHTEFRVQHPHHQNPRWVTAALGHVGDGQRGISAVLEDITFLRGLEHSIDIEPTTGLLTEPAFAAQTRRILADSPGNAALLTIRLAGWASLDHVLPHDMRARLLAQLHTRIRAAHDPARHRQLAGRSGDDVLVLLYELTDWSTVIRLVKQLADWLRDPVRLDAHQIRLQPRIGIAEARPEHTLDDLLRRTRRALHHTADTRDPWIHADTTDDHDDHHALELLAELATAVDTGRLRLDYQPIHTTDGTLAGVRPLPYWIRDGARRNLEQVVTLADQTGLLATVLPHTLTLAARDAATWARDGRTPTVQLLLPGHTVHDEPLLDSLTATVATTGLRPGQLQLAIPAHTLTGNPAILRRLAELPSTHAGIELALTGVLDDHLPIQAFTTVPWTTIALPAGTVTALTTTPAGETPLRAALDTIHAFGARALTDSTFPIRENLGFDLYLASTATAATAIS
ncbi:EAL domain-containing protein [Amycolatopsis sp. NPDC059021]|uniref:EAL domain-containing protein n=1 Tax=Amycolatopsis sp. NPDC059021 TaxID=3346704 RepID=UPI0036732C28